MVNVEETPLITYDVDERNMGKSALAYAEELEDLMLLDFPDIYHGEWNDVNIDVQLAFFESLVKMNQTQREHVYIPHKNYIDLNI